MTARGIGACFLAAVFLGTAGGFAAAQDDAGGASVRESGERARSPYPRARVTVALPTNAGGAETRESSRPVLRERPPEAEPAPPELDPPRPPSPPPAAAAAFPSPAAAPPVPAVTPILLEPGETGPHPSAAGDEPKALAIMNGTVITRDDILGDLWRRRGRETLEWMIGRTVLESELARLALSVAPGEVDARLDEHLADLRALFPQAAGPDDLTRAAAGMRLDEYRDRTVWVELALRKIMHAALPPSDEQLRAYYAERIETFILPERVRISQLFIAPKSGEDANLPPGPADWALAERQANEAHAKIRFGEDFHLAAGVYGSASAVSRWVERGELLRELEDTVFTLRPDTLSAPLRSPIGYHIIRIEERRERKLPPFEDVRDEVRRQYEDKLFIYRAGEFMSQLREKAIRSGSLTLADLPLVFSDPGPSGMANDLAP